VTNPNGHAQTLVASHPGHRNAEKSGAFSRRDLALDPEVQAMAGDIMDLAPTQDIDVIGAVELAKLLVLIDRIDADLDQRGVVNKKTGAPRGVVDLRLRASRRLAEWLDRYGATPKARAEWAKDVAQGSAWAELRERAAARRREAQHA